MIPMKPRVMNMIAGLGVVLLFGIASAWGQAYSHARIVRLSFVEGSAAVQRPNVDGWAEAPMNTPIQEGFRLSTAKDSFVAVEFENGSTLRVGQLSLLEFTQLALASDGSKINRLTMQDGYATFHVAPEGQDLYEVTTPNGAVSPHGKAVFRIDIDSAGERVEVFKGSVEFSSSLGSQMLGKNSVLELRPGTDQPEQLSEGITKDDWDRWVQDQEGRAEAAADSPPPGTYANYAGGGLYGWSDLALYGTWSMLPGYGYGWRPNAAPGWAPYSIGRWCWYPGWGYTWISGDPWGWLPYHYGGWEYVAGIGWVWIPSDFDYWYPALVTWYTGPGWVGWVPQSGGGGGGRSKNPCLHDRSCGVAVSIGSFQNGQLVRPGNTLSVSLLSGKTTRNLGIEPGPHAILTGKPVAQPAGFANKMIVGRTATTSSAGTKPPVTLAPGETAGPKAAGGTGLVPRQLAPGPKRGIVYDSTEGRYVNNPLPSSEGGQGTAQPPSTSGATTFVVTGEAQGGAKTQVDVDSGTTLSPASGSSTKVKPVASPVLTLPSTPSTGKSPVVRSTPAETHRNVNPTTPAPGRSGTGALPASSRPSSGAHSSPMGTSSPASGRMGGGGGMAGGGASGARGGGNTSSPRR